MPTESVQQAQRSVF